MTTVYMQLKPATDVIEAFHRDFTYHDLRSFRLSKDGDIAVWSAGPCGTHLAYTHVDGAPTDGSHVRAVVDVYGNNPVWRRIEFTGPNAGRVLKLDGPPKV